MFHWLAQNNKIDQEAKIECLKREGDRLERDRLKWERVKALFFV
jgi:hypothetical protein